MTFEYIVDGIELSVKGNISISNYATVKLTPSTSYPGTALTIKFTAFGTNYNVIFNNETNEYIVVDEQNTPVTGFDVYLSTDSLGLNVIETASTVGSYYININYNSIDGYKYSASQYFSHKNVAEIGKTEFKVNDTLNGAFRNLFYGTTNSRGHNFEYNESTDTYHWILWNGTIFNTENVTFKVYNTEGNEYTLTNGTITEAGTYYLELSYIEDGLTLNTIKSEIKVSE